MHLRKAEGFNFLLKVSQLKQVVCVYTEDKKSETEANKKSDDKMEKLQS